MHTRRVALPEALARDSVDGLLAAIRQADRDHSVQAIVLEGSKAAFCRGLDLDAITDGGERGPTAASEVGTAVGAFVRCLLALRTVPKPTLALVDGQALGGGVGLAAACDVVVCSERARFAFPEVLFGLCPATVFPLVIERMSPQRARLWAMTGTSRSPAEALAAGLVDEVVPSDRLEHACARWVRSLRRAQRRGLVELKRFSLEARALGLEEAVARGSALTLAAVQDEAVRRAVRQFRLEGTLPWEQE